MENVSLAQSMYVHESYLLKAPRQASVLYPNPLPADIENIFF